MGAEIPTVIQEKQVKMGSELKRDLTAIKTPLLDKLSNGMLLGELRVLIIQVSFIQKM